MSDDLDTGPAGGTNEIPAEVLTEAKSLGWVPKEAFKGKETEWVDADEFVRRGHEVLPIVKENLRRTKEELAKLRTEVSGFKETAEEFRKFTEDAAERKYKVELEALKEQYARAVTDGDGESAAELVSQIQDHTKAPPAKVAAPKQDPDFIAWREQNPWYEDTGLQSVAVTIGVKLNQDKGLVGKALYNGVKEEMAKLFPDKVEPDDVSARGGMFDEGGPKRGSKSNPKAKTYENLPPEDKVACDRFVAKGFCKNREQYVKNYDWS